MNYELRRFLEETLIQLGLFKPYLWLGHFFGWTEGGYVYLIKCGDKYKIGFSKDVNRRFRELRTGNPYNNRLIKQVFSYSYKHLEHWLHVKYGKYKFDREWFTFPEWTLTQVMQDMGTSMKI